MDKGVYTIGPVHQERVFEEPTLHIKFVEDVESLLEMDDLEGMATSDVHGAFDHCHRRERATELIYLIKKSQYISSS